MQKTRKYYLIPIFLSAILIAGVALLLPSRSASAQCGSQASSCKNCHEVQGAMPVNTDGTAWHTQHAQIDACVNCHAGNPQTADKTQAHTGMVAWDSDLKAGCYSCHPKDYQQLAQGYAATLGTSAGAAATTPAAGATAPTAQPTSAPSSAAAGSQAEPAAAGGGGSIVVGSVDYVQQYNETVLGQKTVNWGDVIVVLLIAALLLGGGAFIYWNERRLRGLKGFFNRPAAAPTASSAAPLVEGYSTEVTELLPLIAQLNPVGLHALKRILADPDQANEFLHAVSHLDPELVHRVQALDADARRVLIALAGS